MKNSSPYGDDGGARVGKPDTPERDNLKDDALKGGNDGGDLGAGKEATGGLSKHGNPGSADNSGTVPVERKEEHDSGYGGKQGVPRTSSDQR